MIRILFVIRELTRGGTERRMIDLKNSLSTKFNIKVYPLNGVNVFNDEELVESDGYISHNVGSKLDRILKLVKVIKKENSDIIQSFDLESGLYTKLALNLLRKKVPLISGFGAGLIDITWTRKLMRSRLLMADLYICNSERGATELKKLIGDKVRIEIVRNGIDARRFMNTNVQSPEWANKKPIVGYIGKFDIYKRGDRMINVAEQFLKEQRKPHFVLIGNGEFYDKAKMMVEGDTTLRSYVTLLGHIPNAAMLAKYFDIGVLCSDSEGLPNVLLEYMAMGIPSISTSVGDAPFVLDNNAGILTGEYKVDAIVSGIKALMDDPGYSNEVSKSAKLRFKQFFDISIMAENYERIYNEII